MTKKGIIKNQQVTPAKIDRSRELRATMTPAEREFWDMVRNRRMCGLKFRRQQIIDGFIVDFYCDSLGLCVEIDGGVHDSGERKDYDRNRDNALRLRGLKILRFTNDEVLKNRDYVIERLKGAMEA
jgi:very-short-patch-repair endonuclease